jgi:TonB family protein
LLLAAASVGTEEDASTTIAHIADIEAHLACGATKAETIYVYRDGLPSADSISLEPWILQSDSGLMVVATLHHPLAAGVESVCVLSGTRKATISRKAETGPADFIADDALCDVAQTTPVDSGLHARLHRGPTIVEFPLSNRDRQCWREVTYYKGSFACRTHTLPDTTGRDLPDGYCPVSGPRFWVVLPKPRPLATPQPYYPGRLKAEGLEGQVVLSVLVDTSGSVRTALVAKSSGFELLDLSATRAALDATFALVRVPQRPGPRWTTLVYRFRLP